MTRQLEKVPKLRRNKKQTMNEKTPNRTFPFHSQKCEKEREKRNERVKKVIKTILGQL